MAVLVTIMGMNKRQGLEGERGNPRRGFPRGDEAPTLSLLLDDYAKSEVVTYLLIEFGGFSDRIRASFHSHGQGPKA